MAGASRHQGDETGSIQSRRDATSPPEPMTGSRGSSQRQRPNPPSRPVVSTHGQHTLADSQAGSTTGGNDDRFFQQARSSISHPHSYSQETGA